MAISGQHGGNVLQMANQFGLAPSDVIDFSANINPLGMPGGLKHLLVENLSRLEQYPDIDYHLLHRQLARHHQCSQSHVIAGNGATELIFLWAQYVKPKKALLVEPSFGEYRRALTRVGCKITNYLLREEEEFRVTKRILTALSPDLDCLFLCTPNNPTGLQPDPDLLIEILNRCDVMGIKLFVDESFLDFMPETKSLCRYLPCHSNLYILRSLTKFYALPGLRLGYMLSSDAKLLQLIREQREPWTINALAALAGEVLFDFITYHQATYDWLAKEQSYLLGELQQFEQIKPYKSSANYIFFKHSDSQSTLQAQLMKHSILIRSCANYIGLDKSFYRVAIKSRPDNERLVSALKKVFNHG
ncbi:threonine-phosphate decarboxylase [Vibrio diazotrophicus]|uniref:threonine-phosphate decarboxylase n=1 Tax=Vibrio diazotrophicus TaxID=685 RepID=A0A2J8I0Q1_VIBDI|nr:MULTISPECIES: threonine-phosphate decarboxylase CobD [Vibrio]MCF7363981.1 threonine-phosphate decarboxylase CobD [Vibrio sp. A1-b2]PNI04074.1 threonine-phosphate decarboxylase [Vibrio diazotrophicus]